MAFFYAIYCFNLFDNSVFVISTEVEVDEFFVEIAGHTYSFKEEPETERFIIKEVEKNNNTCII
jgi:hypothetical protein